MPAPPATTAETGSRVVSIIVLVVSLLACAAVLLLTEDDVSASPSPTRVTAPGPGSGADDRSQGSGTEAVPTGAFPLPPGARPFKDEFALPGRKNYLVKTSLAQVKSFYDSQLEAVGLEWDRPVTSETNGRTTGWHGPLLRGENPPGWLDIDTDQLRTGGRRGVVAISVEVP